jgi:hypothetical protein
VALDKDLMSVGAFSLDQLMELAGLSVSQAGLFQICYDYHQRLLGASLSHTSSDQRQANLGRVWTWQQW